MSSVRGGTPRGRGRGSSQPTSTRGRGSSGRYNKNVSRGDANHRGTFGQPSLTSGGEAAGSNNAANIHAHPRMPTQRGAFGTAKTRGSWQDRYQTLMKARERERADAIRHGQIADPDKPRSLAEAVTPVGTCQEMCAEYERVQRVVQKDVWDEELNSNHSAFATTDREPDEARMVKKFRRAAAGLEEQLPSDLRPPQVLKRTCDYLFNEVIGQAPSLAHVHHFVWDRTRAIRNDFSIQQVTRPEELRLAIECYERIARFHILSLHQLALPEKPYSKYDGQQEREQLDRTLLSLMQYYDDSHGRITLPNEAEFRAYCVIFQLQDPTPDLEDRVQTWSEEIIRDRRVRTAVDLYMAACNVMDAQGPLKPRANHLIAQQDWQRFWTLVSSREVSYLMACVAEIYFNLVRRTVLNALFRTFRTNSTMATPDWTVDILCDLLAFDDEDQVYAYCESFGFSFKERDDGQPYLDLTSRRGKTLPEPTAGSQKQIKSGLVEYKRLGRTLPAVINGFSVKAAQAAGLVREEEEDENMDDAGHGVNSIGGSNGGEMIESEGAGEDEDSLFIPETTTTSFSPSQTSLFSNNGAEVKPQSAFSNPFSGASGTSTFGKPSNFAEQSSIFAKPQDQQTDAKTFSSPFSKPSGDHPSIFTKPLDPPTNGTPFTSPFSGGASKIDFSTPAPAVDTKTPAPLFKFPSNDTLISPKTIEPPQQKFSFDQPSANLIGTSATTNAPPQSTPLFSFTTPKKLEATESRNNDSDEIGQLSKPSSLGAESKALSPEHPKTPFVFGEATGASESLSASSPSGQSETKPAAQQSIPPTSPSATSTTHAPSSPGLNLGIKRSSFSTDTKPKKPSPLSNSITASEENSAVASEPSEKAPVNRETSPKSHPTTASSERASQASVAQEFDSLVTRLADDLFHDPDVGLLKQYLEYAVGNMVREVHDEITLEQNNKEADDWRRFTLHQKYGKRWREIFWQRRHAKTGRERRQRRQRRLQEGGSQQLENSSLYDGSSLNGSSRAGSRLEERFADVNKSVGMGGLMSVPTSAPHRIINRQQASLSMERPMSSQSRDATPSTAFRATGHKRLKSTSHIDGKGRITKPSPTSQPNADLLKRSSFLDYSAAKDGANSNNDASMSSYFRLKALGLGKVDSMIGPRGTKRRSESLQTSPATSPPALRFSGQASWSPDRQVGKSLAVMPSPAAPTRAPRGQSRDEDEALFARLRAAREGLKESVSYFQSEIPKDTMLIDSVGSRSSTDSPSLTQARAEARLRASMGDSNSAVPAYRLRESRFVPREHYGRAIERSREFRESRSRDTSRPESRIEQHTPDATALDQRKGQHENHLAGPSLNRINPPQETNGISRTSNDSQKALHHSTRSPFATDYQTPVSFSNHTTQLSSNNPFLEAAPSTTFGSFAPKPVFGLESNQTSINKSQDHTVRPSQIEESLANSFGSSSRHMKNSFEPTTVQNPIPPQQESYIDSEVISLMSDDEEEAPVSIPNRDHGVSDDYQANEEPLDRSSETPYQDSFAQAKARLYQDHDEETESGGWDSQAEDESESGHGYLQRGQRAEYDSEGDVNGYSEEEDERSTEVDEDEEEMESLDGNGEGYDAEEEAEEYDDEEEDEDEEEGYQYPDPQKWQASQGYAHSWSAAPSSRNSALRDVGNSAEEAIELSD